MSQRRKVSWSDLPEELIFPIANRLKTRLDILHFRAVCKEWRQSISLTLLSNKNILSLLLPHKLSTTNPPLLKGGASAREEDFYDFVTVNSLILAACSIFLIKPIFNPKLPPWLITVEELNPGKFVLRKPLSRTAVVNMPDEFPKMLDLCNFQVEEMGKLYSLRCDEKPNHLFEEEHKVLLYVDPKCKTSPLSIDDCTAIVLYDSGVLAAIKLKTEIVKQAFVKARKFDDIVVFKGMVYTVDRYGKLYLMDHSNDQLKNVKMVNIMETPLHSGTERKSRLVESCGELYLVRKCLVSRPSLQKRRMGVRVYMLNQEKNTWDELDSIGDDRILFVTPDCCFFARVTDFSGCKGNCIVLHDRYSFPIHSHSSSYHGDQDYYNNVLKRNGDKLSLEVFHFKECKFQPVESNPGYSVVFWPPPKWLSSSTCSPERSKFEGTLEEIEMGSAQIEDTRAKIDLKSSSVVEPDGEKSQ